VTDKNSKEKNSDQPKYNTRSNAAKKREENNVISNQSGDDISDTNSELNQIEEIFIIQNQENLEKIKTFTNEISTEIRVQGATKTEKTLLLGLLDTH